MTIIGVAVTIGLLSQFIANNSELTKIHHKIAADHSAINHINADNVSSLNEDEFIVFDVRERAEYEVSHLPGAIHVPPDISPQRFLSQYQDRLKGKKPIFYCSVGRRSSLLASHIYQISISQSSNQPNDQAEKPTETIEPYNLIGGIFQWHNENRPLIDNAEQSTRAIHPYNDFWGRLIDEKSAISYSGDNLKADTPINH